jgi:glycosyltransferase involved in cell wall biosynthesis
VTEIRATVIIPTTGDRGPALEVAIASVLRQTVAEIEVFVIGDGVDDDTRRIVHQLCETDPRVRFVDHPKHVRRGEPYRHQVLTEQARGRIVAYLCDRDLWFSDHVEELERRLVDHDIATTLEFDFHDERPHRIRYRPGLDALAAQAPSQRRSAASRLSAAGHTLEAYRRLPYGWRETPPELATDQYMWNQFLDQPWIRATSSALPTLVYLKRGHHPGLPTAQRRALLVDWNRRLTTTPGEAALRAQVLDDLWGHWLRLESRSLPRRLKSPINRLRWRFGHIRH